MTGRKSLYATMRHFALALSITVPSFAEQKPRVALVLSGGGARGGVHIGVLRVLEREGIPIDLIVGASYGALVGGLYAAGYSVDDLERIVAETDWWEMTRNSPDRRLLNLHRKPIVDRQMLALRLDNLDLKLPYGVFAGQKIQHFLYQLTIGATYRARNDFDQLPTPFRAIATDIVAGKQVVFKSGSLGTAIRASISIPGIFVPVRTERTLLIDGGIVNNLPVDVALEAGADFVIAVDCATPLRSQEHEFEDFVDVIDQAVSFRIERKKMAHRKLAHVLIVPDLRGFDSGDFSHSHTVIPIGEEEAESHLDVIWKALQEFGISKRIEEPRPSMLPDDFDFRTWADIPSGIVIDRVRVEGLERYKAISIVELEEFINKPTSLRELERESRRLYATGLFQTVDYQVIYHEDYTELVFQVTENRPSELKMGLRYDNDFGVSALAEFAHQGFHNRIVELYLRGLLGTMDFAEASLISRSFKGLSFLGEIQGWNQDRLAYWNEQPLINYNERRLRARLGMQVLFRSWGGFNVGYQVDHFLYRNQVRSEDILSDYTPALWLSAGIDTRDDVFVPKSGIFLQTQAEWAHRTFLYTEAEEGQLDRQWGLSPPLVRDTAHGAFSYQKVQAQVAYFTSPHPQFSVGFWSHGGYVTQPSAGFFLGGAGHFSNAALRVVGLRRDELMAPRFVSAGISVWRHMEFWRSMPRSAVGTFYQGGLYRPDDLHPSQPHTRIHGFGIGVYVNTRILGPIRIDLVSTEKRDIRIYTAVGFAF